MINSDQWIGAVVRETRRRKALLTTSTGTEIVITRVVDAPRQLVFDALARPELLVHWHGARGWNPVVCEADLVRGAVLRSPMERGMAESYDRLADVLAHLDNAVREDR